VNRAFCVFACYCFAFAWLARFRSRFLACSLDTRVCAKNSGFGRGQTLQVGRRKCLAKSCFEVQKMILERDRRFFTVVLLQMDLGNVGGICNFLFE